jgi:transcriptional regulator with XRE-family HTH domain
MSELLFNRIKETAKRKKNMNVKEVGLALKIGENAIYSWKKSNPSIDKLQKVSDFLDVSTDYLLGRTDNPNLENSNPASDDLDKILDNIKSFGGKEMTDRDRETIRAYLEGKFSDR